MVQMRWSQAGEGKREGRMDATRDEEVRMQAHTVDDLVG